MKKIILILLALCFSFHSQAQWTYNTLSNNLYSSNVASIGNKIIFYSGAKYVGSSQILSEEIEIFDVTANTKQVFTVATGAARYGAGVTILGSKVLFAGGYGQLGETTRVDLYDTITGIWTTATLSAKRRNMGSTATNNKAFFAGGFAAGVGYSNVVDIYHLASNTWTTTQFPNASLPSQRAYLSAATIGNKVLFAGGLANSYRNLVSVYNIQNNTWLPNTMLSQYKCASISLSYQNKAFFIGGTASLNGSPSILYPSDTIDIYDDNTESWSTLKIPRLMYAGNGNKRSYIDAKLAGCKVFMVPAVDSRGTTDPNPIFDGFTDTIAVYDLARATWSYLTLPHPRSGVILATAQNKVYFAGGTNVTMPFSAFNHIDIYTLLPKLQLAVGSTPVEEYSYDFGNILTTDAANAQLDISNEGDYFLRLKDAPDKIALTGDLIDFTLNLSALEVEDTLEPAQIFNIPVSFHPQSAGEKTVTLQIASNDPDLPLYSFVLKGNGTLTNSTQNAHETQAVTIYPVPCSDVLNIQLHAPFQQASFRLTDLNGKVIVDLKDMKATHALSTVSIPNGIYLLQITTNDHSYLSKVVIAH